jgi:hypothetical protein
MSNQVAESTNVAAASAALAAFNAFRYYEQMIVDKNNNQFMKGENGLGFASHPLNTANVHMTQMHLSNVADKMLAAAAAANFVMSNNITQQQQHHQVQQQQQTDDTKCHACGDKSTGSHFGGISCESCKAFFRRSVQRNRWEEYKCSYSGECKMNTSTRKICQSCRYNRCLSIGTDPVFIK